MARFHVTLPNGTEPCFAVEAPGRLEAIARASEELGLAGYPRGVAFHVKIEAATSSNGLGTKPPQRIDRAPGTNAWRRR